MDINGKALERATELIETHILNHIKKSEIGEIKIENNKILISDGVKNEIDVHITIDLKVGTSLIYIFECKDYKSKKVNKNDIIIFEEKINIFNAQKGYFVANNYTRDARNRSKQNSRIELLDLDNKNSRIFDKDYFLQIESEYIEDINIICHIVPNPKFQVTDFNDIILKTSYGVQQTLDSYIREKIKLGESATEYRTLIDKFKGIKLKSDLEKFEDLGRNKSHWNFILTIYKPILNGETYEGIKIQAKVNYKREKPQIIYEYNIKNKGHYAKLKLRGLFKNEYWYIEATKNENDNTIHFHTIG